MIVVGVGIVGLVVVKIFKGLGFKVRLEFEVLNLNLYKILLKSFYKSFR